MDFGALPPEINSGRMYAGAGSQPLLAAAAAWDAVADELSAMTTGYRSVVTELTSGPWRGPSALAMAAAAAGYLAWTTSTAEQATQTAHQARAAVAAYEAAFASTVPPPVITENRARLNVLVATNIFGQNTAAITATEAQYAQMWAQDASAMYEYALAAKAATTLPTLTAPKDSINPAATGAQAAAVNQVANTSTGTNSQAALAGLVSTVPTMLDNLASAAATPSENLASLITTLGPNIGTSLSILSGALFNTAGISYIVSSSAALLAAPATTAVPLAPSLAGWSGTGVEPTCATPLSRGVVLATVGSAESINALSVPPSWTRAITQIAPAIPAQPATVLTAASATSPTPWYSAMPIASGVTSRQSNSASTQHRDDTSVRYSPRLTVIPPVTHQPHHHAAPANQWAPASPGGTDAQGLPSQRTSHELSDLRKQVAELAMEREILMRAAALWAKEAMGT